LSGYIQSFPISIKKNQLDVNALIGLKTLYYVLPLSMSNELMKKYQGAGCAKHFYSHLLLGLWLNLPVAPIKKLFLNTAFLIISPQGMATDCISLLNTASIKWVQFMYKYAQTGR
jgi:hypothetical protein